MTGPIIDLDRIYSYSVIDPHAHDIGSIDGLWANQATGDIEFVGIRTGDLSQVMHLMPAQGMDIDDTTRSIRVPYTDLQVQGAPKIGLHDQISDETRQATLAYYRSTLGGASEDRSAP